MIILSCARRGTRTHDTQISIASFKSPEVTDEPITKIINTRLDIKLGQFTKCVVLSKIKNKKATGLDEMPPKVWKTKKFDDILLQYITKTQTDRQKVAFPLSRKKDDFGIAENYRAYFHNS